MKENEDTLILKEEIEKTMELLVCNPPRFIFPQFLQKGIFHP